jgi:hypothetical protein
MVVSDSSLYLGDNGMCLCGAHLGYSARSTGRDLSGQRVMQVSPVMLADEGIPSMSCEDRGCTVTVAASRVILPRVILP